VRAGFEVAFAVDLVTPRYTTRKIFLATHARRNILSLSGDDIRDLAALKGHRLMGLSRSTPPRIQHHGKMRKNDARNKMFFHSSALFLCVLFLHLRKRSGYFGREILRHRVRVPARRKQVSHADLVELAKICSDGTVSAFFIGWAKDSASFWLDYDKPLDSRMLGDTRSWPVSEIGSVITVTVDTEPGRGEVDPTPEKRLRFCVPESARATCFKKEAI
jgi:hypothetical protein